MTSDSPQRARDLAGYGVQFVFFPSSPNPPGKLVMIPELEWGVE